MLRDQGILMPGRLTSFTAPAQARHSSASPELVYTSP